MPWYLVYASHGPGHQSNTAEFYWAREELDKENKKFVWENFFDSYEFDSPVGDCIRLEGLTEEQLAMMRVRYVAELDNAEKMLRVLRETAVIDHESVAELGNVCSCGRDRYVCGRCSKVFCYAFGPEYGWCPECMSCHSEKHVWTFANPPVVCMKCGVEHPFEKYWARQRKESKEES